MSDLVGNPEDRFSRDAAHFTAIPRDLNNAYSHVLDDVLDDVLCLDSNHRLSVHFPQYNCRLNGFHYENLPMQYTCTQIFLALKIENLQLKMLYIFLIFAQNIYCGYTLEPRTALPRRF